MGRVSMIKFNVFAVLAALSLLAGCGGGGLEQLQIAADWEAGTFTTSSDGPLCAAGDHQEAGFAEGGGWVDYELTCTDGTGTLVLRAVFEPLTAAQEAGEELIEQFVGTWTVTEGTGNYSDAEGGGDIIVDFDEGALATYDGELSR